MDLEWKLNLSRHQLKKITPTYNMALAGAV